ncbi:NAD(P)-dependent oxidoreductase [Streptomyces abyssomicinicus]|uniref:NAD(P)-dependent oxidoreductase n=1 Tax=Streptomyces abyssomicinicus TaxID=574929 RepID=UPI00124FDC10|nr:NAD(P)-dependent oxidoreductase [Streptomyces abyssomicinicus]
MREPTDVPAAEDLDAAVVVADDELSDGLRQALAAALGRPVLPASAPAPAPGTPVIRVGGRRPSFTPGERLVWFHSVRAGVDALLRDGDWPAEVLLTRTVGRMGERMAQYVLGWVLSECQRVPDFLAAHDRAQWARRDTELAAGQLALVYGAGQIGSRVARYLRGAGIRVVEAGRATADEADALLPEARWVIDVLPLTPATRDFFGPRRLGALRGATFVNIGRGATADLAALEAALHAGHVRSAVLDVLPDEPAAPGHLAWRLPRTVLTSHTSGPTMDEDVVADLTASWRAVAEGGIPALAVPVGRGY